MSQDRNLGAGNVVTSLRKRGISLPSAAIVLPTLAIVASEAALFFGDVGPALWGHLATLLLCALAPLRFDDDVAMFQVFALVPVFRLVNLGMPVFVELTVYWFPLVYGPLIPAIYVLGRADNPVSVSINWRTTLVALPLAIPLSAALGAVEYAILEPEALIPAWSATELLVITVVMVGFVGLVEELLFRAVLQRALADRLGLWPGILLASGIFGLMHSGYQLPAELGFAASIGVLFGYVYHRTDSVALVAIMHGVLNVFLFAVIPLQPGIQDVVTGVG